LHVQAPGIDLALVLGQGGSHTVSHDDPLMLDDLADALEHHGLVIPPHGGLLSGMSVGANLALALSDGKHAATAAHDAALQEVLLAAGIPLEKMARLHRCMPSDLNPLELWTVAWAIAMLRAPQLLVLDQPMTDLNQAQQRAVLAMVALYQHKHPTCPVLWLLLSPSLAPSRFLEEAACLC
jgi:ABC-type glutathione transport system ATPase component